MAEDPNGAFKSGFGATLGVGAGCLFMVIGGVFGAFLLFALMASCTAHSLSG